MNICIFSGNLTRDPELHYTTSNNVPVCDFNIAVNRRKKEEADFPKIIAWNKIAENAVKYLKKGDRVNVVARYQMRPYNGDDGVKYSHEFIAEKIEYLSHRESKNDNSEEFPDLNPDDIPF